MSPAARLVAWCAAALVAAAVGCGAEEGECLRYSDCSAGLTCAAGHCVPPRPHDASADTSPPTSGGDAGDDGAFGDDSGDDASFD